MKILLTVLAVLAFSSIAICQSGTGGVITGDSATKPQTCFDNTSKSITVDLDSMPNLHKVRVKKAAQTFDVVIVDEDGLIIAPWKTNPGRYASPDLARVKYSHTQDPAKNEHPKADLKPAEPALVQLSPEQSQRYRDLMQQISVAQLQVDNMKLQATLILSEAKVPKELAENPRCSLTKEGLVQCLASVPATPPEPHK